MSRRFAIVLAALVLIAVGAGAALSPVAVSAAGAQPVKIALTSAGARTETITGYTAGRPLAIAVDTSRRAIDTAQIRAVDAEGAAVAQPLVRTDTTHRFATMMLPHAGPWTLALMTETRGVAQSDAQFTLQAGDADVDRTATLLLLVAACAVLGGVLVAVAAPRVRA